MVTWGAIQQEIAGCIRKAISQGTSIHPRFSNELNDKIFQLTKNIFLSKIQQNPR